MIMFFPNRISARLNAADFVFCAQLCKARLIVGRLTPGQTLNVCILELLRQSCYYFKHNLALCASAYRHQTNTLLKFTVSREDDAEKIFPPKEYVLC